MNNFLKINNLIKKYGEGEGTTFALNDVSLEINEHDFVVILGESGSGKSTLLNIIGGIDKPDSGNVLFMDKDITKYKDKELTLYRRELVGFVYQFFNLLDELNVIQNVTLAKKGKDKDKAISILNDLGLKDKIYKYPRQLSGGEQQRTSIARALNKDLRFLLCDEPTGALDNESGKAVLKLLEKIHNDGKTIILVTHTKEIAKMANRIITMKDGHIVSDIINTDIKKCEDIDW